MYDRNEGEVVGMAVSLCKEFGITPREVYSLYLEELKVIGME